MNKKMEQFKRKCRDNDVLLIDDIQFLENKEGTQEGVLPYLQHSL